MSIFVKQITELARTTTAQDKEKAAEAKKTIESAKVKVQNSITTRSDQLEQFETSLGQAERNEMAKNEEILQEEKQRFNSVYIANEPQKIQEADRRMNRRRVMAGGDLTVCSFLLTLKVLAVNCVSLVGQRVPV